MEKNFEFDFYLTTVFLEDEKTGDVTAFFAQFPEASAQGRNEEEAKKLLYEIFPIMLEDKGEEFVKQFHSAPIKSIDPQRVHA
ncbi:MAG TPA: hypothetical protein VN958_06905 [Chitinophagaceae bacterium]|nr:hypothetical protein [Chitinophagaceae bacterium]